MIWKQTKRSIDVVWRSIFMNDFHAAELLHIFDSVCRPYQLMMTLHGADLVYIKLEGGLEVTQSRAL
jgi:hypothetical protein